MIAQLVRLALADASDLSDNVVLTNISEGVDGAAAMFYNAEDNSVLTTGAGDSLLNSQLHTIDIRALWGSAEQTKLYGWVTARTKLIATALRPWMAHLFGANRYLGRNGGNRQHDNRPCAHDSGYVVRLRTERWKGCAYRAKPATYL
jgi:hypothetical protein